MSGQSDADTFCASCGKKFEADGAFCARCGSARAGGGPQVVATSKSDVAPELELTMRRGSFSELLSQEPVGAVPQPSVEAPSAPWPQTPVMAPQAVPSQRSMDPFAVVGVVLSLAFIVSFVSWIHNQSFLLHRVKFLWGVDGSPGKYEAILLIVGLVATPLVTGLAAALLIPTLSRGLRALFSVLVIGVSAVFVAADLHMLLDRDGEHFRWLLDIRAWMLWKDLLGRELGGGGSQGLTVNVWIALVLNVAIIVVTCIAWYRSGRRPTPIQREGSYA